MTKKSVEICLKTQTKKQSISMDQWSSCWHIQLVNTLDVTFSYDLCQTLSECLPQWYVGYIWQWFTLSQKLGHWVKSEEIFSWGHSLYFIVPKLCQKVCVYNIQFILGWKQGLKIRLKALVAFTDHCFNVHVIIIKLVQCWS